MGLNVLNDFGYSRRYYLRHPLRFLRECGQNLRAAWLRATQGWCGRDVWNMDMWFLEVMPLMLRHLAENSCGYPGTEPFETPEKWSDWLNAMADTFEALQEENWNSRNEYEEEYHNMIVRNFGANKGVETKDDEEVRELYYMRMQELSEENQALLEDTMREFSKYFHFLWD